jgi:hypothetical protein
VVEAVISRPKDQQPAPRKGGESKEAAPQEKGKPKEQPILEKKLPQAEANGFFGSAREALAELESCLRLLKWLLKLEAR